MKKRAEKRKDAGEKYLVKGHGAVMRHGSELVRGDDGVYVSVPIIFGTPNKFTCPHCGAPLTCCGKGKS